MSSSKIFQVLSRKNDKNGIPYRLIVCYTNGKITDGLESRDSLVGSIESQLIDSGFKGIMQLSVTSTEYASVKSAIIRCGLVIREV